MRNSDLGPGALGSGLFKESYETPAWLEEFLTWSRSLGFGPARGGFNLVEKS